MVPLVNTLRSLPKVSLKNSPWLHWPDIIRDWKSSLPLFIASMAFNPKLCLIISLSVSKNSSKSIIPLLKLLIEWGQFLLALNREVLQQILLLASHQSELLLLQVSLRVRERLFTRMELYRHVY